MVLVVIVCGGGADVSFVDLLAQALFLLLLISFALLLSLLFASLLLLTVSH